LAGKFGGRVVLAVASVESLPYPDRCFDAVVDFGILHHAVDWRLAIAEIRRVLKPGGRFFFEEVTRAALDRWLYRTFLDHPAQDRFSEAEFLAELARHGIHPVAPPRRILFKDIFIGVARLQM
jgi:ubiquinone/menaquinone biosynthesis C-methylase UbiE